MKAKATIVFLALVGISGFIWYGFNDLAVIGSHAVVEQDLFSERLRRAADSEESIVSSLKDNMPKMLGVPPKNLDPPLQELLSELSSQQNDIREDVSKIRMGLEAAISDDRNPVYEKVLLEIKQSTISDNFEQIQEQITKNQLFPAAESAMGCSMRLRTWAEQLEEAGPLKPKKPNK